MDWKERITQEKSLLQVYWKARRVATARFNARFSWGVFLVICAALLANAYYGMPVAPYHALIEGVRIIADLGFAFTTAILGFLVAGFAIFASITKPEVFVLLAKLEHKKGDISRLQFIFFNFLLVFIHYLAFLAVSVVLKLTLFSDGPLSGALRLVLDHDPNYIIYSASIAYAALVGWFVFLLMLLKSFIWNMYQAVLVTITTAALLEEIDNGQDGSKNTDQHEPR